MIGYEDDSFVIYSILQDFEPLIRGKGHRSFVSVVRFDNYYVAKQLEMQAEKENEMFEEKLIDTSPNHLPSLVKNTSSHSGA